MPVVLVIIGFLFILNQGYWEETTESLTLVLSSCLICGDGVPIGIAAAPPPPLCSSAASFGFNADAANLCIFDPGHRLFWHWHGSGLLANYFVLPAPIRLTHYGHFFNPSCSNRSC